VGRLAGIRDGKAQFSGSLRNLCERGRGRFVPDATPMRGGS
jgi:hypothetical protein